MLTKIVLSIVVFIIINIGSYVRLQFFQNSISWREFKTFMVIINAVYVLIASLYIGGVIKSYGGL